MKRYTINTSNQYAKIIEKKIQKRFWEMLPIKEISLLIIGAAISWVVSYLTTQTNNSDQLHKEMREKRYIFVDSYLMELNKRFYLFQTLVEETANLKQNKDDILHIDIYRQKFEDAKENDNANSNSNAAQFKRFLINKFYPSFSHIDSEIYYYAQFAESNKRNKDYIGDLRELAKHISDEKKTAEAELYRYLDNSY